MPDKELRLAFAMGGGVSLGTFCGAALSEVLKLAVLRGGYRDDDGQWRPYRRVVVDVFSGASAGALTLAAMLRRLTQREPASEQAAIAALESEFAAEFTTLSGVRREDLIAAQVVQDVQARLWGEEVTIERLLGLGSGRDLSTLPSILDRGAVDAIARSELAFSGLLDGSHRRLLGDRVLFACTVSNLTPILADARDALPVDRAGLAGLADGLTSFSHRELRIFDLNFRNPDDHQRHDVSATQTDAASEYPARWCRYHEADADAGRIGDLRLPHTWAKIAATAVASGAFPLVFAPVVLMRDRYEFGDAWPDELKRAGVDEHPFTYIDGGTFNNEPIREAFRLSAFMDAGDDRTTFDRRVIFVDPFVSAATTSFTLPIHREFALNRPNVFGTFDGFDLVRRPSLDRLLPGIGAVFAAITDEARGVEADKVVHVRKLFTIRDQTRSFIAAAALAPVDHQLGELLAWCLAALHRQQANEVIPPGTLTMADELRRVISEESDQPAIAALAAQVDAFVADPRVADPLLASGWLRLLLYVAVDISLGLEGKHPNSRLLAIGPLRHIAGADVPIDLPGALIEGFGGFTSRLPGRYEIAVARACAREVLERCALVVAGPAPIAWPVWNDAARYREDLRQGLRKLGDRLGAMIRASSLVTVFPVIDSAILFALARFVQGAVEDLAEPAPTTRPYELRIQVPDKRYELDGSGLGDQDLGAVQPVPGQGWFIVLILDHDPTSGRWSGPFIDGKRQTLTIDRDRPVLPDRAWRQIALPGAALIAHARLQPNPIFVLSLARAAGSGDGDPAFADWRVDAGVQALEDTIFAGA